LLFSHIGEKHADSNGSQLGLVLSGVISIILGVALFANPDVGAYAVLTGIVLILLAFRLRKLKDALA